jgi:thiamine biosynthesis lipoprotein
MRKTQLQIALITIAVSMVLSATACGAQTPSAEPGQVVPTDKNQGYTAQFTAMDSPMAITAYGDNAEKAVKDAEDIIIDIDAKTDVYDTGSEVARLNVQGSLTGASPDVTELLTRGRDLSEQSGGTFNIAIRPVTALWRIGHDDARVPSNDELKAALSKVDYHNVVINGTDITLKNKAAVDPGGIAKGYAADRVAGLFREMDIKNALITLSGNIYVLGKNEDSEDWQIGLQDPAHETAYIGVLFVSDTSVVTSGSYERYSDIGGVRYGHLFDPQTGYPVENDLLSVTIISEDSALADAYSTALFVMGSEKAQKFQAEHAGQFDAVLVTKDNKIICTPGIKDSFHIADETNRYKLAGE